VGVAVMIVGVAVMMVGVVVKNEQVGEKVS
jgi:hypothetical protein